MMRRETLFLVLFFALVGCEHQQRMSWPGVLAHGVSPTSDSDDALYRRVYWSANTPEGAPAPTFSFSTPDGVPLTPDSMTIEIMDRHDAIEAFFDPGIGRRFDYGNGWVTAYFDREGNLESVAVILSKTATGEDSAGTMLIGNRDGTQWVALPARRRDLIGLFGEPRKEWSYIPRWG